MFDAEMGKVKSRKSAKNPLTVNDLIIYLIKLGFRYYRPVSSVWKMAFIKKNGENLLCILIRKNGIDLRHYENFTNEININEENMISLQGGNLYRNHYNESKTLITKKIKVVASTFARGEVHENLMVEDGRSYALNPNFAEISYVSNERFQDKKERMMEAKNERAISNYIRDDCGGYLGGGDWL